jgi:hypothetical protein
MTKFAVIQTFDGPGYIYLQLSSEYMASIDAINEGMLDKTGKPIHGDAGRTSLDGVAMATFNWAWHVHKIGRGINKLLNEAGVFGDDRSFQVAYLKLPGGMRAIKFDR